MKTLQRQRLRFLIDEMGSPEEPITRADYLEARWRQRIILAMLTIDLFISVVVFTKRIVLGG